MRKRALRPTTTPYLLLGTKDRILTLFNVLFIFFAVFFHAGMLNLNYLSVALCYEEMTKVESLNPLRTLHSAVPLKEMDRFFDTLIGKKLVFPTLASRSRTISKESNFSELSKGANENLDSS